MSNLRSFDIDDIKSAFKKVKAAVLNLSETEQKVRDATNNEPWMCSTELLAEIARITLSTAGFNEVMRVLYWRLSQDGRTWRNIYKSLMLLDYLLKNGPERVASYAHTHIYDLKACLNYNFIDEKGKDQGINVRHRAKLVLEMLENGQILAQERQKVREDNAKARQRPQHHAVSSYSTPSSSSYMTSRLPSDFSTAYATAPPSFAPTAPSTTPAASAAPAAPVQTANLISFDEDNDGADNRQMFNHASFATSAKHASSSSGSGDEDWADFAAAPSASGAPIVEHHIPPQISNCPPMMPPISIRTAPQGQAQVQILPAYAIGSNNVNMHPNTNANNVAPQVPIPMPQQSAPSAADMMWSNIDSLMTMSAKQAQGGTLPAASLTPATAAAAPRMTDNDDFAQFTSAPTANIS